MQGPRFSAYRLHVTKPSRLELVPSSLTAALFDPPVPELAWTGDAMPLDRVGVVRSALEVGRTPPEDAAKLMVFEPVPALPMSALTDWISSRLGPAAEPFAIEARRHATRSFGPGERLVIAYEARSSSTRVSWPWGPRSEWRGPWTFG